MNRRERAAKATIRRLRVNISRVEKAIAQSLCEGGYMANCLSQIRSYQNRIKQIENELNVTH